MKAFTGLPLSIKVLLSTLLTMLIPFFASYGYILTPEQIEFISGAIVTIAVTVYAVLKTKKIAEKNSEKEEDK